MKVSQASEELVARSLPRLLQATYLPATREIAFWGGGNTVASVRRLGLPLRNRGSFMSALPLREKGRLVVRPALVPACLMPVEVAAQALANRDPKASWEEFSDSVRAWQRAIDMARKSAPEHEWAALVTAMPVAAHAVLGPDSTAIRSAASVVTAFRQSIRTADEDRPVLVELRDYQRRGVDWLLGLAAGTGGGVLADDMGLGKTVQAICLLAARCGDRPHLVVCPTSLLGTWERELARFAPGIHVVPYHGPDRTLNQGSVEGGSVAITTYSLLRQDESQLLAVSWDVVVLDEAQQIKNPNAQATEAACRLDALVRVAMTGTPVENNLEDLWSLMNVTNPGLLGSRARFRHRFAVPIEQRRSTRAARRLKLTLQPYLLRRTKQEVASELPAKQHSTVVCTLTREQATLYQELVARAFKTGLGTGVTRHGRVLALLTRLKQVCNHPEQLRPTGAPLGGRSGKLDRTAEMLVEVAAEGQRALVFTQYRAMGELLQRHLADVLGLKAIPFLHGGLNARSRDRLVQAFQHDEDAGPVLIVSLRAGGFGLTLTRATHVVHYDRWWNPAVEDQATDRAHRIGQQQTVNVYTLLARGTVDEHIAQLHEAKRSLAAAVVGLDPAALARLPDRDLRALLDLSTGGED